MALQEADRLGHELGGAVHPPRGAGPGVPEAAEDVVEAVSAAPRPPEDVPRGQQEAEQQQGEAHPQHYRRGVPAPAPRAGRGGGDQADMGAGDGDVRVGDGTATVLVIECLQFVISTIIFNIAGAREWTISEFPSPTAPARVCKN